MRAQPQAKTEREDMTRRHAYTREPLRQPETCTPVQVNAPIGGPELLDAERYEVPGFAWIAGE